MLQNVVTSDAQAARYREQGLWTAETLSSRVAELAAGAGESVAVIDRLGRRQRTYSELARDAADLGALLANEGVSVGDVVSIQLPNCYEAVVAAVATNSLGAVLNPLLPNYRAREISHVFSTATPKAVFVPATYRGFDHVVLLDEVTAKTGIAPYRVVVDVDADDAAANRPGHENLRPGIDASAVSELIFTSGTEATPKAIMHTEETANFAVRALFSDLELDSSTVVWMPSPVGHSTGFNYGIRAALYHGAPLVLQDRWDAADAAELVGEFGCQYTLAATTFLDDLVGDASGWIALPSLTHFGCGGAPVPGPLVARRRGGRASACYACTGRRRCSVRPGTGRFPAAKRAGTDGYALRHTEIEVRDEDGKSLAPPAEGELHTRGPNTSVGLSYDPERTAAPTWTGAGSGQEIWCTSTLTAISPWSDGRRRSSFAAE